MSVLTPALLLRATPPESFPMAERADDPEDLFWVDPERRGILPLDRFHLPRRLRRTVRLDQFEVRCDVAFEAVISACAEPAPDRPKTWINDEIRRIYSALHRAGPRP